MKKHTLLLFGGVFAVVFAVLVGGTLVLRGLGVGFFAASDDGSSSGRLDRSYLPLSEEAERAYDAQEVGTESGTDSGPVFETVWFTDFKGDRVVGVSREGAKVWEQHMGSAPIPPKSRATNTEYVTVAPSGNLIVSDGDGMMVQEIDRETHELVWQFGVKDVQGHGNGLIHQPDKAFKINEYEVLINDGNNRRVIIVDQRTDEIVWQYGETLRMGSKPGFLRGNTSAVPLNDGNHIVITDTLDKRVIVVDRQTKNILHEWEKPDAKWLQHLWATKNGALVMEDRQKNEVFKVAPDGSIAWTLTHYADGSSVRYPTDVIQLNNGNILIAEAGRGRIVEVVPSTGEIVWEYSGAGFVTTVAIDE